jgi:hypothetical protein
MMDLPGERFEDWPPLERFPDLSKGSPLFDPYLGKWRGGFSESPSCQKTERAPIIQHPDPRLAHIQVQYE